MYTLLRKIGLGDTIAAITMIVFGVLILWKPDLLGILVAIYLIVVGLMKLLFANE